MFYRFHVNVYAMPEHALPAEPLELRGVAIERRHVQAFDAFLPVTFEQAAAELGKLPRIDAEPDGFFVIAGEQDQRRWQVDGHLFDFNDQLHRMELHGECPPADFDALLQCVGWPETPLAFELVREGVAVEEPAFRAWACS
jgi:hypothetical protein